MFKSELANGKDMLILDVNVFHVLYFITLKRFGKTECAILRKALNVPIVFSFRFENIRRNKIKQKQKAKSTSCS